jgi:hypothetical protein
MHKKVPREIWEEKWSKEGKKGYLRSLQPNMKEAEATIKSIEKWFCNVTLVIRRVNIGTQKKPEYAYAVYDVR